jgi:hypothetical protein
MRIKLTVIIYIMTLFFFSCEKENNYEGTKLCLTINDINEKDQRYRSRNELVDPIFEILDSLRTAENITKEDYIKYTIEEQLAYGKRARRIADQKKSNTKAADSLMKLQIVLDNENTETLIDIIKIRGYPNEDNSPCNVFPGGVFIHSQEKYWKEIRALIEKEYKEKRMKKPNYEFVLYHINGRKSSDRDRMISR